MERRAEERRKRRIRAMSSAQAHKRRTRGEKRQRKGVKKGQKNTDKLWKPTFYVLHSGRGTRSRGTKKLHTWRARPKKRDGAQRRFLIDEIQVNWGRPQ